MAKRTASDANFVATVDEELEPDDQQRLQTVLRALTGQNTFVIIDTSNTNALLMLLPMRMSLPSPCVYLTQVTSLDSKSYVFDLASWRWQIAT